MLTSANLSLMANFKFSSFIMYTADNLELLAFTRMLLALHCKFAKPLRDNDAQILYLDDPICQVQALPRAHACSASQQHQQGSDRADPA
jgi:hypothetical protein